MLSRLALAVCACVAWLGGVQALADSAPIIGIDLGTTFSVVGVWNESSGQVDIIPDEDGNKITPSYVQFDEYGQVVVGHRAKETFVQNPASTVYGVKRVLGRDYDDVIDYIKEYQYKIVETEGKPYVEVHGKQYPPETISGAVLSKMKSIAQKHLGVGVTKAVVTVPAYFKEAQRRATMIAGKVAGLEIVRIINEPTAAAIAYGLDKRDEAVVLVYDLGGGTFDVSLLTLDDGVFQVEATNGDTNLGGEDFDQNIVNLWRERYSVSASDIPELKRLAEQAKIAVSSADRSTQTMKSGVELTLTKQEFEDINAEAFERTLVPVRNVLEDANKEASDVNEIVLVGGSTRIPKIQQLLSREFGGRMLNKDIHPDEAVAYGAAVQGQMLHDPAADVTPGTGGRIVLLDVTPLTLGIEIQGGYMAKILNRNTPVPVKKSQPFTSVTNNQKEVRISVYEGERPLTKDNHLLDTFSLTGLPPGPKGSAQIEVTFEIDVNGILHVSAHDKKGGSTKGVEIDSQKHRLSEADILRFTEEAERYMIADRHEMLRMRLADLERDSPDDEDLRDTVDEILDWLNVHENDDPKPMERKLDKHLGKASDHDEL